MDLRGLLDEQVGDGPEQRSLAGDLAGGRRRLRRRRLQVGAGSVAAVLVVGGLGWSLQGAGAPTSQQVAQDPTPTQTTETPISSTPVTPTPIHSDAPGATGTPPASTPSAATAAPSVGPPAPTAAPGGATPTARPRDGLAVVSSSGVLQPKAGVQVIEQRPTRLTEAPRSVELSLVAQVSRGGARFWVVGRFVGGESQVIGVKGSAFASLAAFETWAKQRYASGEGLL